MPSIELRKYIGVIIAKIIYEDQYLLNINAGLTSVSRNHEISEEFKILSSKLKALAHAIIGYDFISKIKLVPPKIDIDKVSKDLIGISHGILSYNLSDSTENQTIAINDIKIRLVEIGGIVSHDFIGNN